MGYISKEIKEITPAKKEYFKVKKPKTGSAEALKLPKNFREYNWTEEELITAAEACNGTFTSFARCLNCKSSLTAKFWLEKFPNAMEAFINKKDLLVDLAEDTLFTALTDTKNPTLRYKAAEFVCKTIGREKYGEKITTDESQGKLIDLVDKLIGNALSEEIDKKTQTSKDSE